MSRRPTTLPVRMSESVQVDRRLRQLAIQSQKQRQVLHRAADGADRRHAADHQQVERRLRQHRPSDGAGGGAAVGGRGRGGSRTNHAAGNAIRIISTPSARSAPRQPRLLRQRVGEQRNDGAAEADAEIRHAHRLATAAIEPA